MRTRSSHHLCDILDGDLGSTVCTKQPVCFLKSVGKLRVAESAEKGQVDHGVNEIGEHTRELVIIFGDGVSPGLAHTLLRTLGKRYSPEFGQHDRLTPMRVSVQCQKASARPPSVEQLFGLNFRAVALA